MNFVNSVYLLLLFNKKKYHNQFEKITNAAVFQIFQIIHYLWCVFLVTKAPGCVTASKRENISVLNSNPPVQIGSSPLHCRSPWQRRIVTSKPLGILNPGLQRTSSRAEKEWVGERRRATEFSLSGRGQGQVRPEEERRGPDTGERKERRGTKQHSGCVGLLLM